MHPFVTFKDINGADITLATSAIWAVTTPADQSTPSEILLQGAEKSVKIPHEAAHALRAELV